jgi:REP element-mobilizing transposase RayT
MAKAVGLDSADVRLTWYLAFMGRSNGEQMELAVARRPSRNGRFWGGRRKGAGRKPANGVKAGAPHVVRPKTRFPMHVSMRVLADVPRLRQRRGYQIARRALQKANRFEDARICEISIQGNHVHLIVEADTRGAMTRAMKSFAISFAKNVNARLRRRRGPVVEERYHEVALRTPAQTRAAIAYVLGNWRRHGEDVRMGGPRRMTDVYSSGPRFDGWSRPLPPHVRPEDGWLPTTAGMSWLLRGGWRMAGLIDPFVRPGPA